MQICFSNSSPYFDFVFWIWPWTCEISWFYNPNLVMSYIGLVDKIKPIGRHLTDKFLSESKTIKTKEMIVCLAKNMNSEH